MYFLIASQNYTPCTWKSVAVTPEGVNLCSATWIRARPILRARVPFSSLSSMLSSSDVVSSGAAKGLDSAFNPCTTQT